jgi:four helix bundle protein
VGSAEEIKQRTKGFAIEILRLTDSLPRNRSLDVLCKQVIRSATSVGANYRSACVARSRAEFISKLHIAREEADETGYWLELLKECYLTQSCRVDKFISEAGELTAIFTASIKTAQSNRNHQ